MDKILNIILVDDTFKKISMPFDVSNHIMCNGTMLLREVQVSIPDVPQPNFVCEIPHGYFAFVLGVSNAS
jgi:hypothetical protein